MEEYLKNKDFTTDAKSSNQVTQFDDTSKIISDVPNSTSLQDDYLTLEEDNIPKYIAPKEISVERFWLKK